MSGATIDLSKRTNIRILVRLEKGSFVTFGIFVSDQLNIIIFVYSTYVKNK